MEKVHVKLKDDIILLSSKRCAFFFDVTPKTLLEWKKAGCPQAKRGWWNIEAVYRWRHGLKKRESGEEWTREKSTCQNRE